MDIKKLFRAGNSLVVSLGSENLYWLGVREGDRVIIQNVTGNAIQIKKVPRNVLESVGNEGGENG